MKKYVLVLLLISIVSLSLIGCRRIGAPSSQDNGSSISNKVSTQQDKTNDTSSKNSTVSTNNKSSKDSSSTNETVNDLNRSLDSLDNTLNNLDNSTDIKETEGLINSLK